MKKECQYGNAQELQIWSKGTEILSQGVVFVEANASLEVKIQELNNWS